MDTCLRNAPKRGLVPGGLLLPLVVACLCLPAHAAERNGINELPRHQSSGNSFAPAPGISIDKATAIARKQTGGRVLSATSRQRATGIEYHIRMLVDGERVITVTVDHQGHIKNNR